MTDGRVICLACGKHGGSIVHSVLPPQGHPFDPSAPPCDGQADCGGSCCLATGHVGEHECIGDSPGEPGTCPA